MTRVPQHYIPNTLSKKDKKVIKRELNKSRKLYKKQQYHTRKNVKGYKSKKTSWENRLREQHNIPSSQSLNIKFLSKRTKCSPASLNKIIKKGMGAYYSSGSRPNQTPFSWGKARLYSALSGGPASKVDHAILKEGCHPKSKTLRLAKHPRKNTKRSFVLLKGGTKMKERIVKFTKSPIQFKKYRAYIKHKDTQKERHIDFGDNRYQQYQDRTPLKLYKSGDHNDRSRMRRYFTRHSGTPKRKRAIQMEKEKSKNIYNAKILSHEYLW
jgi:hypothetical protein